MITQTHNKNNLNITLMFHEDFCSEVIADIVKKSEGMELKLTRTYWRDMTCYPECSYLTSEDDSYIKDLISKIFNIYPDANNIE